MAGDSDLRFEVLGPPRAWRGERELDLGPAKQRAVLAALLLNANEPVAIAQIVDAVWQEDPPGNGPNVVQKHIAGLRRVMEPHRPPRSPSQVINLTNAGYVLTVALGRLGRDVFEERVQRSQLLRAAGRAVEAQAEIEAALALWRGNALAGLPGTYFDIARTRLIEKRATALEACAEIGLELARHAELVPELVRLVSEYPFREQPRYLLMLALYRCGRQAEALAAYRAAHRILAEEFGVEPGERLRALHLRILRSDSSLSLPSSTLPPAAPPPALPPTSAPPTSAPPTIPSSIATAVPAGSPFSAPPFIPALVSASPVSATADPIRALPPAPINSHITGTGAWPRRWLWVGRGFLIAAPLLSCGFLTPLVFAICAARRRSWPLGVFAFGYFALLAVAFSNTTDTGQAGEVFGYAIMGLWVVGSVHAGLLYLPARRDRLSHPIKADLASPLAQRVRREQARQLVQLCPSVAHELRIGRPDLPRAYDDGGLIDINAAPAPVIATLPGITPYVASVIVADRQQRGPFSIVDELVFRGLLPAAVLETLRDALIAIR